jgi:hypothetical protein
MRARAPHQRWAQMAINQRRAVQQGELSLVEGWTTLLSRNEKASRVLLLKGRRMGGEVGPNTSEGPVFSQHIAGLVQNHVFWQGLGLRGFIYSLLLYYSTIFLESMLPVGGRGSTSCHPPHFGCILMILDAIVSLHNNIGNTSTTRNMLRIKKREPKNRSRGCVGYCYCYSRQVVVSHQDREQVASQRHGSLNRGPLK